METGDTPLNAEFRVESRAYSWVTRIRSCKAAPQLNNKKKKYFAATMWLHHFRLTLREFGKSVQNRQAKSVTTSGRGQGCPDGLEQNRSLAECISWETEIMSHFNSPCRWTSLMRPSPRAAQEYSHLNIHCWLFTCMVIETILGLLHKPQPSVSP